MTVNAWWQIHWLLSHMDGCKRFKCSSYQFFLSVVFRAMRTNFNFFRINSCTNFLIAYELYLWGILSYEIHSFLNENIYAICDVELNWIYLKVFFYLFSWFSFTKHNYFLLDLKLIKSFKLIADTFVPASWLSHSWIQVR